jgi:hypothetical protein
MISEAQGLRMSVRRGQMRFLGVLFFWLPGAEVEGAWDGF